MMRGIDVYPWKDLIHAIIHGAQGFKAENGYLPPLLSPATFNERIFIRKFLAPLPIPSLADKLIVREFVRLRVGESILPKIVWRGENVDTLFATKLPNGRYVLKANHGCQWNLFLDLPDDLVIKRCEIEQQATSWLISTYGYKNRENGNTRSVGPSYFSKSSSISTGFALRMTISYYASTVRFA